LVKEREALQKKPAVLKINKFQSIEGKVDKVWLISELSKFINMRAHIVNFYGWVKEKIVWFFLICALTWVTLAFILPSIYGLLGVFR